MEPADVDALVVLSFGGPESLPEVVPFLRRVTAGRGVPDERLAQVATQYEKFGGRSPLNHWNRDLVRRLAETAPGSWRGERVYLANRNSAPFCADTFAEMARAGIRRAAVFVTSAFSSYSGCRQYRENLAAGVAESGVDLDLLVLPRFHDHPKLCDMWADRVVAAAPGPGTRVLFVTHSLPVAQSVGVVPGVTGYGPQHEALAAALAGAAESRGMLVDWRLVFQSRSGPPSQPWLEPDISDAVVTAAADGCRRVVVVPIGFLADNLEIRWDLDVVAGETARQHGLAFERLEPPQSDPRFCELVWDLFRLGDGRPCHAGCCPNPHGPQPAIGEWS